MTTVLARRPIASGPGRERRGCSRWPAASSQARLAWEIGRPPFRCVPARLVDISENGAQVATESVPRGVGRVWVRLDAVPCEWVRATVKAVCGTSPCYHLHLAFREPCPPGVLEAAIAPPPDHSSPWDDAELRSNLSFLFEDD